jgi:hypothetical protein
MQLVSLGLESTHEADKMARASQAPPFVVCVCPLGDCALLVVVPSPRFCRRPKAIKFPA